ncbi:hypothetical protein, partial [Bradyrhizobium brasilense]|uniref:hypothetical protein n=1 Tax=Bradyrhizobium brasilense TaxID=1419277 RepID=UPI001E520DAC
MTSAVKKIERAGPDRRYASKLAPEPLTRRDLGTAGFAAVRPLQVAHAMKSTIFSSADCDRADDGLISCSHARP